MACKLVNVTAPNGTPSILYQELVDLYGEKIAQKQWLLVEDLLEQKVFTADQLRANKEPTLEAAELLAGKPSVAQLNAEHTERLLGLARKGIAAFKARLSGHEASQKGKSAVGTPGFEAKRSTLLKERRLVERLNTLPEDVAFLEMVEYSVNDLTVILQFLRKQYKADSEAHNEALLEIAQHLDTYGIFSAPELAMENSKLRATLNSLNTLYGEASQLLIEKQLETKADQIARLSTNPVLAGNAEAAKSTLTEGKDVDKASRYLMNTQTSSVPAIAVEGKLAAVTQEEIHDAAEQKKETLEKEFQALIKAQGSEDLSWLHQLDENGKTTGKYVAKVGQQYWDEKRRLKEQTLDDEGNPIEYVQGPSSLLTPAQKAHNIQLSALHKAYAAFRKPEQKNSDGDFVDGENNRYTAAFKAAREKWQQYREDAVTGRYSWLPNMATKANMGDKFAQGYEDFLAEHYSEEFPITVLVMKDGKPTGEVEEMMHRSVRREYIEEGYSEKWLDKKYAAFALDNSTVGEARRRFYAHVDSLMQHYLDQMPMQVRRGMRYSFPVFLAEKASSLNTGNTASFMTQLKNKLTSGFNLDVFARGRFVDEDGRMAHDLPMEFVGGYKNQKSVQRVKSAIAVLQEQRLNIIAKEGEEVYTQKLQGMERKLALEENKLEGAQTETNILRSLGAFIEMGENYVGMRKVETSHLLAIEVLKRRNVYVTNSMGAIQQVDTPEGKKILLKREGEEMGSGQLWDYLVQNIYRTSEVDKTAVDKVAEGIVSYSSHVALGLNFMASAKNYLSAKFGAATEGRAKRYFRTEDNDHAVKEGAAASLKRIGNIMESIVSLEDKKVPIKSDFDATISYFNLIQSGSDIQNQSTSSRLLNKGMLLTEGVEYTVQSESGYAWLNARVLDKDGEVLTREGLAKKLGVKEQDAAWKKSWEKLPRLSKVVVNVNGKPQLREGITLPASVKNSISVHVKNMNKELYGNYDQKDKIALKKAWLGRMMMQFHGWLPPMAKARFGAKYYDEGTGMEMEGRYRAMYRIFQELFKTGKATQRYKSMSALEQANVKRTLWELGYAMSLLAAASLLKALAGSLPEDDDKARMCINFLQRTSMATGGELLSFTSPLQIYQNLKNPLPATRLVGQAGQLLANLGGAVYYPATGQTDKLFYKTGVQKGNLKLWKSTKDLVPMLSIDRQIDQLEVSGDFFVK